MHIRLALGVVQEKCAFLRCLFASLSLLPGVEGSSFRVKTKVGSPFGQQFCTQNWMKSSAMMTSDPALRLHLASLRFKILVLLLSLFLGNIAPSRHLYPPPPPVKDTEEHELLWLAWDDWPVCICFPSSSRRSPAPPGGHMFLKPRAFSAGTSFSLAYLHYQRANNQWQQRWVSYWIERESLLIALNQRFSAFCPFSPSFFRGRGEGEGSQHSS